MLERLASFGLMANFMVYLQGEYHMDQVKAATILNAWYGAANFTPVIGAFISDIFIGKFQAIVFGSFASLLVILCICNLSLLDHHLAAAILLLIQRYLCFCSGNFCLPK